MRFVKKDLSDIPPTLSSSATIAALELIAQGDKGKINDDVYKGTYKDSKGKTQSEVRDYLNKYYFSKCAYCEMLCKAEMEHYRAKKGVLGDNKHKGYYWLCYEWSNLLPSCRYCNTEGGKGNQFPIIQLNKRVYLPNFKNGKLDKNALNATEPPLIDEEPYLIHPEIDEDLDSFFEFKISTDGKNLIDIEGIDPKNRAKETIKICNLNREYLRLSRFTAVYYPLKQEINQIFMLVHEGYLPLSNLEAGLNLVFKNAEEEANNAQLEHTLLRKFIIQNATNFENRFAAYIENEKERECVVEAFKKYKII